MYSSHKVVCTTNLVCTDFHLLSVNSSLHIDWFTEHFIIMNSILTKSQEHTQERKSEGLGCHEPISCVGYSVKKKHSIK